jgi:hypothetical protein
MAIHASVIDGQKRRMIDFFSLAFFRSGAPNLHMAKVK